MQQDEKKERAIYAAQIRVQTSVQAAVVAEELSRQHTESVQQLSQKVRVAVYMNTV
jgi:hypothetical protein